MPQEYYLELSDQYVKDMSKAELLEVFPFKTVADLSMKELQLRRLFVYPNNLNATRLAATEKKHNREAYKTFILENKNLELFDSAGVRELKANKSFLMRSIVMNERTHIKETFDNESRTLRKMWYRVVKPTLDKLEQLNQAVQTEEDLQAWGKTLSKCVAQLLRAGYTTYRDLNIVDRSRDKSTPYAYNSVKGGQYQVTVAPYPNTIIATEKDTIYPLIADIADLLGTSCISCQGQNALGAMEGLIESIMHDGPFDSITILTLTDYDAAGYYIADALKMQAQDILKALGHEGVEVVYERIGLTPDQLDDDIVQANKYTPKPANIEKWMAKTNGINGEPKGLELDALTTDQARQLFIDRVEKYIDESRYTPFAQESYIRMKALEAIEDSIEAMLEKVVWRFTKQQQPPKDMDSEDLRSFGPKADIVQVKDNVSVIEYARNGDTRIPVDDMCDDSQDDKIAAWAINYFGITPE